MLSVVESTLTRSFHCSQRRYMSQYRRVLVSIPHSYRKFDSALRNYQKCSNLYLYNNNKNIELILIFSKINIESKYVEEVSWQTVEEGKEPCIHSRPL